MKNIVVPTDFSNNAYQALVYAINFAKEFKSTIHLVNCVDSLSASGIYTDVSKILEETAQIQLSEMIDDVSSILDHVLIKSKTLRGERTSAICDYTKSVNGDLIIMGTKGATGLKEAIVGTVTEGVVKSSETPVLVISENATYEKPKRVAFAIDDQPISNDEVVSSVKEMVEHFNAQLTIFHFNKGFEKSTIDPNIESFFEGISYILHDQYSEEKNINKVINDFVESENADLLVMIKRKRSFFSNLFHKSVTAKEAFHSKIPLLILHDIFSK